MLGKSQIWVETYPSAQSPFQKLNFGNSSHKTHKRRCQTFLVMSSFTGFPHFVPNILSGIVVIASKSIKYVNFVISYITYGKLFPNSIQEKLLRSSGI